MPARWELDLAGVDPARVKPEYLHAVACAWLGDADHNGSVKPFTVSPLRDGAGGAYTVELSVLDDTLTERLPAGLPVPGDAVRLGRQHAERVGAPRCAARATWAQLLAEAGAASAWLFRFVTPVTFRTGRRYQPLPLPASVFGHLRARWNHFAPGGRAIDLAFDDLGLTATHFRLATVELHIREPVVAATGELVIDARTAGPDACRRLDTLARFAAYAGVGAMTTVGLGVTEVEPVERPVRR